MWFSVEHVLYQHAQGPWFHLQHQETKPKQNKEKRMGAEIPAREFWVICTHYCGVYTGHCIDHNDCISISGFSTLFSF